MSIEKVLLPLYIKILERKIKREKIPNHVMLVAEDTFPLDRFIEWCSKFGINEVTLCTKAQEKINQKELIKKRKNSVKVNIVKTSGRDEILTAIKKLAEMVEKNEIDPESVDEKLFESFLEVKSSPDLIIRVGNIIPDFLIWQSIYSELYFADVDLKKFRYVDFLRCLRDYQRRERRYGR